MSQLRMVSLCQTGVAGCASCCGIYNYSDRNTPAFKTRIRARTDDVKACNWDPEKLRTVRDTYLESESSLILTTEIKSCPFAGYLEEDRMGCLIHPRRHPKGEDLRDLAVYPREVCEGHHCAPHDWLEPREKFFAQACRGAFYGTLIADAGLVKALVRRVEFFVGQRLKEHHVRKATAALDSLFDCLSVWPDRDPNPRRFGAYTLDENATERRLGDLHYQTESILRAVYPPDVAKSLTTILMALSSRWTDAQSCLDGAKRIEEECKNVAVATGARVEMQDHDGGER